MKLNPPYSSFSQGEKLAEIPFKVPLWKRGI
jgi:hypothetical protein